MSEPKDPCRPFPIQSGWQSSSEFKHIKDRSTIPWWLAEIAYEFYASRYGRTQTLERLAQRGGFCPDELVGLIRQEKF